MLSLRPLAIVLPLAAALRDPKKLSFVPSEDLLAEPGTETETPGAGDVILVPSSPTSAGFLPLCAEEIVEDTCLLLNADEKHEDGDDWTTSEQLEEQLASYKGATTMLWDALELPQSKRTEDGSNFWIDCRQLCESVVSYVQRVAVCPEASDISCYNIGTKTYCDLDVRPSILKQEGPTSEKDIPDFGDKGFLHQFEPTKKGRGLPEEEEEEPDQIVYHLWEMVERVANLFRIYPTERPNSMANADADSSVASFSLLEEASGMSPSEFRLNKQKEELAKAYMGIVIRAFSGRKTQQQMTTWFGSGAFSKQTSRKEILRVLNSVDHMISNVLYVYPGKGCKKNTYAYVYPKAYKCNEGTQAKRACTTMKKSGKYVFYLCPLYFERPREMVETLVHEGSHHATAFTDDVDFEGRTAYGRSACKRLAKADPSLALKNADNFCYYIQDTATQVSNTRADVVSPSTHCPRFARVRTPDQEGDCKCPVSRACFHEGTVGCPYSRTPSTNKYSPTYFSVGCEGCSCVVKPATTTTTTTTTTTMMAMVARSWCPSFAAVSRPDREGDCFCYGQTYCVHQGSIGCPYSKTPWNGRFSELYFSSGCTTCTCMQVRRPQKASRTECPSFALVRLADREGDCYCYPGYHCTYENKTGCPVATEPSKQSHRLFDMNCEGCECLPDASEPATP